VHAEVTKHVLPGCKSLGCSADLSAAVGTIWEASKLGGLNIKKYLQPRNHYHEKSYSWIKREADLIEPWGRPMTLMKKQVKAISETAGIRDEASKERFAEITSGGSEWQQGLVATCKDFSSRLRPK
jgi:hypothetical protein